MHPRQKLHSQIPPGQISNSVLYALPRLSGLGKSINFFRGFLAFFRVTMQSRIDTLYPIGAPMSPRFLCPNCGSLRKAFDADCGECNYPHQARAEPSAAMELQDLETKTKWFQFDIMMLLICTTVTAGVFAGAQRWGFSGLWNRLFAGFGIAAHFFYVFRVLQRLERDP